jgi:uncharacterized protein
VVLDAAQMGDVHLSLPGETFDGHPALFAKLADCSTEMAYVRSRTLDHGLQAMAPADWARNARHGAMDAADLIDEVARRLALAAPGARVILFGSRARGDEHPESDIDLLVIEPGAVERPRAESARLRRELRGLGVGLDVLVVSARHAEDWGHLDGSVLNDALSDGRVLVEA